jgi:hypothetical protein
MRSVVRNHGVLSHLQQRHRRRRMKRARAAEGQQTLEIEPTQLCANQAPEALRAASIERLCAHRRQSSFPWNKPVTPEVAGSSPVAPVSQNTCKTMYFVDCLGAKCDSEIHRLLPSLFDARKISPRTTCKLAVIAPTDRGRSRAAAENGRPRRDRNREVLRVSLRK